MDAGVKDGRLRDARHTAAAVLLILGVPDAVADAIMGWEPGGAARMRARYMHVTGTMLRKVAQQVGGALWVPPGSSLRPPQARSGRKDARTVRVVGRRDGLPSGNPTADRSG